MNLVDASPEAALGGRLFLFLLVFLGGKVQKPVFLVNIGVFCLCFVVFLKGFPKFKGF